MAKFRKKPIVIDAWQVAPDDGHTRELPPSWVINAILSGEAIPLSGGGLDIRTNEGVMRADVGDWIIREPFQSGSNRKLYPCKPDIFARTYEPTNGDSNA